jgi:hypothetical protein
MQAALPAITAHAQNREPQERLDLQKLLDSEPLGLIWDEPL